MPSAFYIGKRNRFGIDAECPAGSQRPELRESVEDGRVWNAAPAAPVEFQPTWFDRQGKAMGGSGERGIYYGLTLSPDGTRAAVAHG